MATTHHRWIVDGIAETTARCEVDGGAVVHVPRWVLPPDARERSVLAVRHHREGRVSRLEIEVDAHADEIVRDASRIEDAQARGSDIGDIGDIAL